MYNLIILAFDRDRGAFTIPLQTAKKQYGHLPSEYKVTQSKKRRQSYADWVHDQLASYPEISWSCR